MGLDAHRRDNQANWDDRARVHLGPGGYPVDEFIADPSALSGVVRRDVPLLGDLTGARAVHLQCHIGTDTLSLARLGAQVTGVDLSGAAIDAARDIAARAELDATFIASELYDAPDVLEAGAFDLVYVSVGSLCWLPDILGWARVVAGLLAPGGRLHIRDVHPMLMTLADDVDDAGRPVVAFPYFETTEPTTWDDPSSYSGEEALTATISHEWNHGLAEIVTAVMGTGLTLTHLSEQRELEWPFWPWMERTDDDAWVLPEAMRDHVPLMFTLQASAPATHD